MSLLEFITHILNVKSSDIEEATTLDQDDGSLVIRVRLVSRFLNALYAGKQSIFMGTLNGKLPIPPLLTVNAALFICKEGTAAHIVSIPFQSRILLLWEVLKSQQIL